MAVTRIAVSLRRPEDVIPHLGSPTHWKQGRSAKSLADAWFQANDFPPRVRAVLKQEDALGGIELIDAWLERCTDLADGRATASQTDLLAVAGLGPDLLVIAVEGKVTESFDKLVSEWLADGSEGKQQRLNSLCQLLGLEASTVGNLRYQFFHRTAAAILEARRFRASKAILLIHSFCPNATGLRDYVEFGRRLGFERLGRDDVSEPRVVGGIELRLAWVSDEPLPGSSRTYRSVDWLTEFGRTRLSKSFFMRDFLFSDIAAVHGLSNIPDNPKLAIEAGTRLCGELLEPLQEMFGRIAIRSAYRSPEVNGLGNAKGYSCATNEANFAAHIWDVPDANGHMGAMASIVVPSVWDRFQHQPDGWQRLAWWIHDHLPYSSLYFFPKYWAFNIGWHERPERRIDSYVEPVGCLTKLGMPNHKGSHEAEWRPLFE
jgi:hypothetical protein